jgi:hypothetical protein
MESSCHLSEITNKKWQNGTQVATKVAHLKHAWLSYFFILWPLVPPFFKHFKKIKI